MRWDCGRDKSRKSEYCQNRKDFWFHSILLSLFPFGKYPFLSSAKPDEYFNGTNRSEKLTCPPVLPQLDGGLSPEFDQAVNPAQTTGYFWLIGLLFFPGLFSTTLDSRGLEHFLKPREDFLHAWDRTP
jgi:hypothetical protein